MLKQNNLDFLSVGDVFNDTFIELEDAHLTCDVNHHNCTISMKFGDKLPYKKATLVRGVGNAGNAAVSAARLGASSGIFTYTGNDEDGKKIEELYASERICGDFIYKDSALPTNNAYVLQYEVDRTILVKQEAYPYEVPAQKLLEKKPRCIYLTSIGKEALEFQINFAKWLEEHKEIMLAFQPGTFQLMAGREKLDPIYKRSDIFFSNIEEAERILGLNTLGIKELLKRMRELGPKIVVITDGPRGAHAYDGERFYFQRPYPDPKPPLERTGAGDAFSSTVAVALALGKSLPEALQWGAINSMSVVQEVGAQKGLLNIEKIQGYLKEAPEDFPTEIIQI